MATENANSNRKKASGSKGRKKDKEMDSEIRELFRIFDKNHDNTISANELGKVLKCMGMQLSDEEIGMYMEELDKEGSGRIEYREFHNFMQEELKKADDPAHREQAVRSAFKVFDKESEGLIELAEFKSTMKTLGDPLTDEELDDMLKTVNVTEDEKINYEGPSEDSVDHETPGKKRKDSESSETSPEKTQSVHDTSSPKTATSETKTDVSTSEDPDTAGGSPNPSSAEPDKRNRSLEALFVVTDNELQNIARQPDSEQPEEEQILVLNDLHGEQIVITETTALSPKITDDKPKTKLLVKSPAFEQEELKLVYTKQASESTLPLQFIQQKTKRIETFTKSQSEILCQNQVEIHTTPAVGRKRKHPLKPGKHICSYCGRGCAKPSVLEKHLRAHTGERPFPCLDCGFSFKTKSNLYKHCKSRAHALKVNQGTSIAEEIVETEITEEEVAAQIVEEEEETESASDHEDQNQEKSAGAAASAAVITQYVDSPELMTISPLSSYKKKVDVGKLIEWSKNLEMKEKKKSHAMLEVHSHYPIKIAPKHGVSMDALVVPEADTRPRLYSQKSTPEYTTTEVALGRVPSMDAMSISTSSVPMRSSKGISLPVIMSTDTKGPPVVTGTPLLNTKEPSITITTESVILAHPSLGKEAAKKGLRDLEELTARLNSPDFQGIQISTSFNRLPDKSLEVIVHIASSAEGQRTGKSELKQKIEALVSATSAALGSQPNPPTTSTPTLSSTPSFNRSDSKNLSSEHIKEHIQQLISANAAIVDMPMSDAPRPRAKNIFRQISDNAAFSQKVDTPCSTPLSPMLSLPTDTSRKQMTGKPLLSAMSLPNTSEITKKENLARKTDQLKKLNALTGSQTLSITSDLPRGPIDRSTSLNVPSSTSDRTRGSIERSSSFSKETQDGSKSPTVKAPTLGVSHGLNFIQKTSMDRTSNLAVPGGSLDGRETSIDKDSLLSPTTPGSRNTMDRSSSFNAQSLGESSKNSVERASSLYLLKHQGPLSKSMDEKAKINNEFKIQIKLSKTQADVGVAGKSINVQSQPGISTKSLTMSPQILTSTPHLYSLQKSVESSSMAQRALPEISVSAPPSEPLPVNRSYCPECGERFKHQDTLDLHKLFYCEASNIQRPQNQPEFEHIQKMLIANYFQKTGSNLKRSASTTMTGATQSRTELKTETTENLEKPVSNAPKSSLLRPSELPLSSYGNPKLAGLEALKLTSGPYLMDKSPTDITAMAKGKAFSRHLQIYPAAAPIQQGSAAHYLSPRIMTPTSIPVMLNLTQQRQVLVPQSPVLTDQGTPNIRPLSIGLPTLYPAGVSRSISMVPGAKTPNTPTPSFQTILPNASSIPLIGQPMISPLSSIPVSEAPTQSQAVSDMKLRLKDKLLLKRSMSAEKSKEGSIDSGSLGSKTPGTPVSGNRPIFGDCSKLAQLLTKEGVQSPHSKRPKLGELKQMNSGQLKAVDYAEDDTPVSGNRLMKSRSSVQLGSSISKQGSLLPLSLSQSLDEKGMGTMTAAILIKEGSTSDGEPVQIYSVPVVMAQPFFSQTKGLSSGYHSHIEGLALPQNTITLISPVTSSKTFPGSKTVKELLIQKSQEAKRSPSIAGRSFSEVSIVTTPQPLQYDKGVNTSTTQQLRDKISIQEKHLSGSPKKPEPTTPQTPRKVRSPLPLNLYGHLIATLRSSTHVSYCCVQRPQPFYVPISANKKISMYSNWKAAPHNPNPAGLTSKDLLTLYKSRYTSNPVYAEGGKSIPNSLGGFVTHSTYWTYHKQREGQDSKSASSQPKESAKRDKVSSTTLEKVLTKIRETTPEGSKKESETIQLVKMDSSKKEKICKGGFKTDEEYTYIRGRGRGNYVCETCGIRCRKPSMLKKHIRTHTDHRPYHCRHCKFSFKTKGNLTKHMKSKAHQKKCVELGIVPVPTTVEDCQIDDDELAAQMSTDKDSGAWAEESIEDDDGDEDKDGSFSVEGDEEEKRTEELERAVLEVRPSSPVYVAVQVSESNQPALMKITQKGSSASLGTVYGFDGQSYADRAMTPDKSSDPARAQVIDTEIARSLLELSKNAESEGKEDHSETGEKKETRLGNLIGALMSRTKPLSGLQSKDDNSNIPVPLPQSVSLTFTDEEMNPKDSSATTATKRPSDLFLGSEDQPSRKRFFIPSSTLKTPKDKEVSIYPQTPLNASILSYLPPCISTKVKATKDSNYRGPIVGQIIQQDGVVMTPVVSSASSTVAGVSFQFSHPFQIKDNVDESDLKNSISSDDVSGTDAVNTGQTQQQNAPSSSTEESGKTIRPRVTESANQVKIFLTDDTGTEVWNNQSSDDHSFVCDVCQDKCLDSHDLAIHKRDHCETMYNCERCDLRFISETAFTRHLQSPEHASGQFSGSSNSFKCIHCGVSFSHESRLHKHLRSQSHFKELEGLGVISPGVYEYLQAEGKSERLDVSDTDQYFQFLISKSAELTRKQDDKNQNNSVIQTSQSRVSSEKQFAKRSDYEKHDEASNERVTVEIKQEPIDIGEIGRGSFASSNQIDDDDVQIVEPPNQGLITPVIIKEERDGSSSTDGPHLCGICRQGFNSIQELRSHILTHAEPRPYICEYCDAGFTNAQSLKTHLHTHMQERPYVCGRCGDTFTQADDLHLHMSTHSSLLPVKSKDQSLQSIPHLNQSTLRPTISLDQSKTLTDGNQSVLKSSFSVDQSKIVLKSSDQSSSLVENQSSSRPDDKNQSHSVIVSQDSSDINTQS